MAKTKYTLAVLFAASMGASAQVTTYHDGRTVWSVQESIPPVGGYPIRSFSIIRHSFDRRGNEDLPPHIAPQSVTPTGPSSYVYQPRTPYTFTNPPQYRWQQ